MQTYRYQGILLHIPNRYYHNNLTNRFKKNIYEKPEVELVQKYINDTHHVLELGSCLGFLSAIISKKANSIISVEANPELYECLELTRKANNLNVTFLKALITEDTTPIKFQTYDNIVAGSADRRDNGRGWGNSLKTYNVTPMSLHTLPNIEKINAIVMDIEGGELPFVRMYKTFLQQQVDLIIVEIHGHLMKDASYDQNILIEIKNLGFEEIDKKSRTYVFKKTAINNNEQTSQ